MENRTVLFVDDDPYITRSLERVLRKEPFRRIFASSGFEAQKIIKEEDIQVVVTDMLMPGMDGLTLLKWVENEAPDIIRVVLSMRNDTKTILNAINSGHISRYITKPWDENDLISVIRQSIEWFELKEEKQNLLNKLEKYNRTLEQMVEERTNQLLAIKSEAEIGKHTSQIVHNLNNSLSNIQGSLDLLGTVISADSPDMEKLRTYHGYASTSAETLGKIVAEILIRAREKDISKEEDIDINQLIEKELLFWEINPLYKYKIKKEIRLSGNLPLFRGSQIQIKQILDNLIKNAIDALENSETKELVIGTELIDKFIRIEISDTGEGISEENISRIFLPGYTSKPIGKGTGLGLASVRTMVEAYSGSIEIHSTRGKGTTFHVNLPV